MLLLAQSGPLQQPGDAAAINSAEVGSLQVDGRQLLRSAASNLFNSNPLHASARLTVQMFDQKIEAQGQYWQLGQGSASARLEFVYGDPKQPQSVLQICHRGFYYRFQSKLGQPELQIADLAQIADVDQNQLVANRQTWMSTGGLSNLMEQLATNFEFGTVESGQIGQTPCWRLRGGWNQDRLRELLTGQVKSTLIQKQILWDQLPKQIPHSCEVLLGGDDYFPLFPYRVSYFQRQEGTTKPQEVAVMVLEFFEVDREAAVPEEQFQVRTDTMLPIDLSRHFTDRVRRLEQLPRSAGQEKHWQTIR
jgi:hypothetical protein